MALSGDGKSLYTVSEDGAGVAHLKRAGRPGNSPTRVVSQGTKTPARRARELARRPPTATPGASESGFDDPESLALSGNGLYLVSEDDDAVIRFKRDQ